MQRQDCPGDYRIIHPINNNYPMAKIKKILEFILALLNFLFHFKPTPDEETIAPVENYPRPASPPGQERAEPLFETIP
jgi:hypothetical protein